MNNKIKENIELNAGHYHEIMDRLHIIIDNLDNHILKHPVSLQHKKIRKKINKAIDVLSQTYQLVGNIEFLEINVEKEIK